MESIEAVVVGDGDVSAGFQQNRQHVIPLLADGIMERRVSLRVLWTEQGSTSLKNLHTIQEASKTCLFLFFL